MDTVIEKFYPYSSGRFFDQVGGDNQFYMEVLEDRSTRGSRIVRTPLGNRAAVWDLGTHIPDKWSIFLVDYEVFFTIRISDLEAFWSVCDRIAAVTVALDEPRDCCPHARPYLPNETRHTRPEQSSDKLMEIVIFTRTFRSWPVVNRFLFQDLFPEESRPRPLP